MAGMNPAAQQIVTTLANQPMLLMKMKILSLGKNYDVMDAQQQVLCRVGLDANQNVKGQLLSSAVASVAGDFVGRWAARSLEYTYDVTDPNGQVAIQIRKGKGGQKAQFQVVDPVSGGSFGHIDLQRSIFGGMKAFWVAPDGQQVFHTKGNLLRRKYSILNTAGQEIGKVSHKILAIRDTWQLELNAGANHLYSAIFAVVIDFEKKM